MRDRRGSQAVEFALALPLLMLILTGSLDAGEYLFRMEALVQSAADGARAGAKAESDATGAAEVAAEAAWQATGQGGEPEFTATLVGEAPDQRVTIAAELAFTPWVGLVPLPGTIGYRCTFRLDHQPEE
ncbi:MAG: TadE/TadG family type IV pilus assembly protein [Myxococcota bacterium]